MRSANNSRAISVVVLILLLSAGVTAKTNVVPSDTAAKLLPDQLGKFKATGPAHPNNETNEAIVRAEFNTTGNAARTYVSEKGERLTIAVITTTSDANAYALLTTSVPLGQALSSSTAKTGEVGTASYVFQNGILLFFKGLVYAAVSAEGKPSTNSRAVKELARIFSDTLDKGEGDIPVLVKHLPDWPNTNTRPLYAVSQAGLKDAVGLLGLKDNAPPTQPVLDAVSFAGGVEAVAANYGAAQLVIVEFNTPQLASDNDARINAKIQELHAQRAAAPTAYRRVGNYSVFVFNGTDEQAANKFIDQIKYQKVVQWLGTNPNIEAAAAAKEKDFVDTTLGVFVSVVKASGLAILLTLGVGGFFGAVLFRWRRSQRTATEAYSDAGGMLRLNIDELTPQTDPSKLIGPGR